MTADVFISYSREDKNRVIALAEKLREAGVSLWIDQGGIDGAAMWSEQIVNALEGSKVLMLMVTEKSVNSHNVVKEVTIASERKGLILPVHLEPTRIPAGLKYPLAGIQHIEYFQGDPDENLKTIVRSLERAGVTISPPERTAADSPIPMDAPSHSSSSAQSVELPIEGSAVAVIPFDNLSPDADTDYFSDGLTEELINTLSSISEIEVVSRMTSGHYKGTKKDARTIGRETGARYLAGGSVRKFQENIRISARLVDATSNREIWAQTYKGKLDDIFDIQEQVAKQIADALKLKLSVSERVVLSKRPTASPQAYDLYLRGKEYLYQLTKRSIEYAIQLFERAIELDPRYAAAYAACSNGYGLLYSHFKRDDKLKDMAQELGLKALMYDNNSPEAYAALAYTYYFRNDYDEAIRAGQKSIDLDPDNFLAYWIVGRIHYTAGNYEQAESLFLTALNMEPGFYSTYNDLELIYKTNGRDADASDMRLRLLELLPTHLLKYPDDSRARVFFAARLAKAGRIEEAMQESTHAMKLSGDDPLMLYNVACVFAQLENVRMAVQSLREAITGGYEHFDWLKRDSDLDPIRNDPEYIELMKGR